MICFYKTAGGCLQKLPTAEPECWISVISPTEEEIRYLTEQLGAEPEFVRAALDEEESSRVEREEEQTLVIVDVPVAESQEGDTLGYSTMPMGILTIPSYVITVSLRDNAVLSELRDGIVRNVKTQQRNQFVLTVLLRVAARFLQYLKQIDKISSQTEKLLHRSMRNKELIQLLGLEKSLVFFSTSLKADEITLEKIYRGRIIKLSEEDEELLEDVIIELKQAIEMCNIYSGILSGTMDAFASIISNNLNIVMKVLTSITIVLSIPNIVYSFYGMNVQGLPLAQPWFPLCISLFAMLAAGAVLLRHGMLK